MKSEKVPAHVPAHGRFPHAPGPVTSNVAAPGRGSCGPSSEPPVRRGADARCCAASSGLDLLLRRRNQTFAHGFLSGQLARAPDGLAFLPRRLRRRLLIEPPSLHFPKNAFTLHPLFQNSQRLIDVVVANENLQLIVSFSKLRVRRETVTASGRGKARSRRRPETPTPTSKIAELNWSRLNRHAHPCATVIQAWPHEQHRQ
jgi:hypothetical protein